MMAAARTNIFCKNCLPLFSGNTLKEEAKEEETSCSFCVNTSARMLFNGQPSCYSCHKDQKNNQRTQHKVCRSQDTQISNKSASPRRLCKPQNQNVKSLLTLNPLEKPPLGMIHRISTLQTDEEIRKGEAKNTAKNKNKSLFGTTVTIDASPVIFQKKSSFTKFIENLAKHGLDSSSAIFRANEGELSAKEFHSKCDSTPNLVIVILFSSGYILGTYQELPMSPDQKILTDENAVIFTLFGGEKAFYYDAPNRKIKYEHSGLCFGVPTGLLINMDVIDESFCGMELKYKSPLGGDVKFKIAENFVWSIMVKEVLAFKLS